MHIYIAPPTHVLTLPDCYPVTQQASHSLPHIPPFHHGFAVPAPNISGPCQLCLSARQLIRVIMIMSFHVTMITRFHVTMIMRFHVIMIMRFYVTEGFSTVYNIYAMHSHALA